MVALRPTRLPALILVPLLLGVNLRGPGTAPSFARAFAIAPGSTRTATGSGRSRAIAAPGATAPSAAAADAKRGTRQEASEGAAAWVPPSQNAGQRRGNVFAIRKPEDLLDFVAEDDRLGVGE